MSSPTPDPGTGEEEFFKSWEVVDHATVPEGTKTLMLVMREGEFAIQVDGRELMGSDLHGSEDALADLACDRLRSLERASVLVGGLGMGFTLAAVLRRLGEHGSATLAELVPEVVRWNTEHLGHIANHPLRDPRVEVHVGDVFALMEQPARRWDAILLDVDNGPLAFTRQSNGSLYTRNGLQRAWRALNPGGVLGVWSSKSYPFFTRRLRKVGFKVEIIRHRDPDVPKHDTSYTQVLWMARRP